MKKITTLLVVSILSASLSSCLLTDKLFQPLGSVKGQQIIDDASTAASIGYYLGLTSKKSLAVNGMAASFYKQLTGMGVPTATAATMSTDMANKGYKGAVSNAPKAMVVAPVLAGIEPDATYTKASADSCVNGTRNMAFYMGQTVSRTLGGELSATWSKTCYDKMMADDQKGGVACATAVAAQMAPLGLAMCKPTKTGQIIDLGHGIKY